MRVCIAYDCLFPYTIGGAERWYRSLSERLVEQGHEVTYLTLRQWPAGEPPSESFGVVAVGREFELYVDGRRRSLPPLAFGAGVFRHLLSHGDAYDVVHTASFPYFHLPAAAAARRRRGFPLFVDWFEVWTRPYWREYLGAGRGDVGWRVQRACLRIRQTAFCFSTLHERRLRDEGFGGEIRVLGGVYDGDDVPAAPEPAQPLVVFAGRHIPEKRVTTIVPAVALARERVPELRATIFGDGPERRAVVELVDRLGLDGAIATPGFVGAAEVEAAMRRALCLILPSVREGYGLVVVEAAAKGTPSVVVRADDNAATELVEEGVNGTIAPSAAPEDIAAAILRVHDAGQRLRDTTADWFARNRTRLSAAQSAEAVAETYREQLGRRR